MHDYGIEDYIKDILIEDAQKNALAFVKYLRTNEMIFERLLKGYWENKLYWLVKLNDEYVCFILISDPKDNDEPWIIWSDDSGANCYENYPLENHMKQIAWKYVDSCAKCGSCSGGKRKMVFGKEFDNICRTTFRFDNPDVDAMEFMKTMVEIRKADILKKG